MHRQRDVGAIQPLLMQAGIELLQQSRKLRIFGQGGFAVIAHPEKLTQALPLIYRQLVTG